VTFGPQSAARRVLAIDDDPISLAIAAVLLEAEGCIVLQAGSGEEALAALEAESSPPDCILADLRMPSLSGTDLAVRLRAAAPGSLLLAMSATPPPHVDGYDGVLRKPLSPDGLRIAFSGIGHAREEAQDDSEASEAVVDPAVFERLRRAMTPVALEEVVSAFLLDTVHRIDAMRSADPQTVTRQAHTVRGGAAMVGAVQVSVVAAMIEAGIDHESERLRKLDELETHLRRAEQILKQRLSA